MLSSLLLALAPAAQAVPPAPDTALLAMTRDGVRVEVVQAPAVGALEVRTPWGLLRTPLDPVAVVLRTPRAAPWRMELAADPGHDLGPSIDALASDGRLGELLAMWQMLDERVRAVEPGARESLDAAELAEYERRREELLRATRALESWGTRLDPLPGDLTRAERVEELWDLTRQAPGPAALLPGTRLLDEIILGQGGVGDLQLSLTALRDGLRASNPCVRRVAAKISGKELISEPAQNAMVLVASLEDEHPVARDGAADGSVRVWPDLAREYWTDTLLRWREPFRTRAAWHLVDHLPFDAAAPLVAALASEDVRPGQRVEVNEQITITVVTGSRKPNQYFVRTRPTATPSSLTGSAGLFLPSGTGSPASAARGGPPAAGSSAPPSGTGGGECPSGAAVTGGSGNLIEDGIGSAGLVPRALTNRSANKVTRLEDGVRAALTRALARLAGEGRERDRDAWLAWFAKQSARQP